MSLSEKVRILGVGLVTALAYFLTVSPMTKPYLVHLLALSLFFVLVALAQLFFTKERNEHMQLRMKDVLTYSLMMVLLLWVGVTGWFFSPFFYFLYLLGIALAFLFTPVASLIYVALLTLMFLPNVGSIDLGIDLATIFSLFSIIPLTYYLRKEYLRLTENEKKILILEEEKSGYTTQVEELLGNKIVKFGVSLREPINDIKQLALFSSKLREAAERDKNRVRIVALAEKALRRLRDFEEVTTGKKLLRTPRGKTA